MDKRFLKRCSASLLVSVLLLTGCNDNKETPSDTESVEEPVGDFNFVDNTPQTTRGTADTVDPVDSGVTGDDIAVTTATDEDGEPAESIIVESAEADNPVADVVSDYVDIASNYSLRLGKNVYVSVPMSLFEKTCDLDTFLTNFREVRTLTTDTNYDNKALMEKTYQHGTCLYMDESRLYMEGIGMGYMCQNKGGSLAIAKGPSMNTFNLGKLTSALGNNLNSSYNKLGELISSEETEYYYKAVYKIADLEDIEDIDARAMLCFDKTTYSLTTAIVYKNSYCTEDTFDLDVITESFRYQGTIPDNLAAISFVN